MDITQTFYDNMADQYDQLFSDWQSTTREQGEILDRIFQNNGYDRSAKVLDCACGIGTQAIGLAALGYPVTASDISCEELKQAKKRAKENAVTISFFRADFSKLKEVFSESFDLIICMDNALPHMLTKNDLEGAVQSIVHQLSPGGMFVASIRDYDELLFKKPSYSPPYIHKTEEGQRVSFQTWTWEGDLYQLRQYIIADGETLSISKFDCTYRAVQRGELTELLKKAGCKTVEWIFPEETGFYQPILIGKK